MSVDCSFSADVQKGKKQESKAFLQDTEKQLMFLSSLAWSVEVYENTLEGCTPMKIITVRNML